MVAGFLAGYLQSHDYDYAIRLGSAAGSATAFSPGLACRKDIMHCLSGISLVQ
jgi:Fructose-1-phosphate kinase and related fructose-6-phosphate kinase (PfkB)